MPRGGATAYGSSFVCSRYFFKRGLGLLFCRVNKGVSKNRSVSLCAEFVSCKQSSFRSKQAKLEIAATDRSLLGELTAPR